MLGEVKGQKGKTVLSCLPRKGKVPGLVVVGEVAKARHPDITCDEDPDCIVHLFCLKVMIQQEENLQTQTDMTQCTAEIQGRNRCPRTKGVTMLETGDQSDQKLDERMHTEPECLKQWHALVCCVGGLLILEHGTVDYNLSKAQFKKDMRVQCVLGWQM